LLEWLAKWNVPYDEILFGKPWPGRKGFYIDDRTVRPDEFLSLTETEIHRRLGLDQ
jgi:capsule biosynthesis phosphatase